MRSLRRLAALVQALVLVLLAGCGTLPAGRRNAQADAPQADARPLVLASFTVLADMAENVACGRLRVESLIREGAEVHGYVVTPADLRRARGARLLLENGLGLERWMERFAASLDAIPRVVVSKGVATIPIDAAGEGVNPHAWMSPGAARTYVVNLRQAFSRLDPEGTAAYSRCAAAYLAELERLDADLRRELARLPEGRRLLVSCEGAFSYLARDYGLEEAWLWPVNGEKEVTPRRMRRVIATVRERRVPAVFCESTVDDRAMRRVAAESGARFAGTFHVDSLSPAGGRAPDYLSLMRHNVDLLGQGLAPR